MNWSDLYWDITHRFPFKQLRNIKWWFYHRLHPRYRYNLIRLPLEPGYYDVDTRLISAMFELLKWHVDKEREGPEGLKDSIAYWGEYIRELQNIPHDSENAWKKDEIPGIVAQKNSLMNMLKIYNWYTKEKPAIEKQIEECGCDQIQLHMKLEQEMWEKDEEMLILIVKIRHHLWT